MVVAGLTHTATIALVELGLGLVLLLCALNPAARRPSGLIGMTMLAGGLVFLAEPSGLLADLGTESALGWLGVVGGALLLASLGPAGSDHRRAGGTGDASGAESRSSTDSGEGRDRSRCS